MRKAVQEFLEKYIRLVDEEAWREFWHSVRKEVLEDYEIRELLQVLDSCGIDSQKDWLFQNMRKGPGDYTNIIWAYHEDLKEAEEDKSRNISNKYKIDLTDKLDSPHNLTPARVQSRLQYFSIDISKVSETSRLSNIILFIDVRDNRYWLSVLCGFKNTTNGYIEYAHGYLGLNQFRNDSYIQVHGVGFAWHDPELTRLINEHGNSILGQLNY